MISKIYDVNKRFQMNDILNRIHKTSKGMNIDNVQIDDDLISYEFFNDKYGINVSLIIEDIESFP